VSKVQALCRWTPFDRLRAAVMAHPIDLSWLPSPNPSSSETKRIVILNLFQDNKLMSPVILKQVQDDETERICTSLT
jgi:hypothetical protein